MKGYSPEEKGGSRPDTSASKSNEDVLDRVGTGGLRDDDERDSRDDGASSDVEGFFLEVIGRETNEDTDNEAAAINGGRHIVAVVKTKRRREVRTKARNRSPPCERRLTR